MAIAEKKVAESKSSKPLPLPVVGLLGVGFLAAMFAAVFSGLPWLWYSAWAGTGFAENAFASGALLGILCIAALVGASYLGWRLIGGAESRPGLRASIFVAFSGILLLTLICASIGRWIEGSVLDGWLRFLGTDLGIPLAALVSVLLFWFFGRIYFRPTFTKRMERFESQGWFTAKPFKPGQGLRVRRGTMLGILLLAASGTWVLINKNMIGRGDWRLNVPFTTAAKITDPGDAIYLAEGVDAELRGPLGELHKTNELQRELSVVPKENKQKREQLENELSGRARSMEISRRQLREINAKLERGTHNITRLKNKNGEWRLESLAFRGTVEELSLNKNDAVPTKIREIFKMSEEETVPGDIPDNRIIAREDFRAVVETIQTAHRGLLGQQYDSAASAKDENDAKSALRETTPMTFETTYGASVTLLPSVQYIVPLLMIGLSVWLSWRIVNLPAFGDFLVATEAEVNKISWTTRQRLYQDTIVVLTTVILMAVFLSIADFVWLKVLSWKHIGVLKVPEKDTNEQGQKLDW